MSNDQSGRPGEVTVEQWAELEAQMHELEVLMEETDAPPSLLPAYMQLSVDLIAFLDEMNRLMPAVRAGVLDPRAARERYLATRQQLMGLQARAQEIILDGEAAGEFDG